MRAWIGDRVSILEDAATARLFLRYHSEARTTFHRSYNALVKALSLDAEGAASAENPPADLVAASSPNEANLKAKKPLYRPTRSGSRASWSRSRWPIPSQPADPNSRLRARMLMDGV
jgi:hypothetical protein